MSICSVDGCERPVRARTWCTKHIDRWYRLGSTDLPPAPSIRQRLMAKVEVTPSGCWNWTGSLNTRGYGMINVDQRKVYTHRVAYEALVGPIPDGLVIDHLCRNHACLNPAHLEPVTPKVNMLRGYSPPAQSVRSNKCHQGHEDWYIRPDGMGRICRPCKRERERHSRAERAVIQSEWTREPTREEQVQAAVDAEDDRRSDADWGTES